jgi:uroporphyrinogen-III synthase
VDRLKRCTTVSRGPKPAAVLFRYGIRAHENVEEPYTTRELLDKLLSLGVSRKYVALLHYGERNRPLGTALRIRGARLAEYLLYEWQLPSDTAPLQQMVLDIIEGRVDAVAFTNQIQIRHLTQVAEQMGRGDDLSDALVHRVVVASIGPSCSHQLQTLGITPRIVPPIPKMRPLIASLAQYMSYAGTPGA